MIEVSDALDRILTTTPEPVVERQPLAQAVGRFLLEDLRATVALPGFDQSAIDGYAVRSADLADGGRELQVTGFEAAGGASGAIVGAGEAARVFTGAPLPAQADAVVMQEDVERQGDRIRVTTEVAPGDFVRRRGEVLCRGQQIARAGERLDAENIGLLATQGLGSVAVGGLPKVGVVTTGDELVEPGEGALRPGQIYNSNGAMLEAGLRQWGVGSCRRWHVRDDLSATVAALGEALGWADVLLVAGGVSVGERDFVKPALAECGIEPEFWRVRVKPGKPLLYAATGDGTQVFGLPGNPVSALVGLAIFALPALHARMGAGASHRGLRTVAASLAGDVVNPADRPHYLRGSIDGDGRFVATGMQASHGMLGLAMSDALLLMPPRASLEQGEMVTVKLLD